MTAARHSLLAAACLLALAGCNGDPAPAPAPLSDPPSPTAASDPTGSSTTPTNPPTKEAWEEKTKAGADAFARHWVATFNDARSSGDTAEFRSIGAKSCQSCTDLSDRIEHQYEIGGTFHAPGWKVKNSNSERLTTTPDLIYGVWMNIFQPRTRMTTPGKEDLVTPPGTDRFKAEPIWTQQGWKMREFFLVRK